MCSGGSAANPTAWIGAVIVVLFLLVAALAPWLAPYPETAASRAKYITPTYIPGPGEVPGFPLGLDRFGGDVLSKLIWGAQASLMIGVISTAMGLVGGMILGLLAGTFGGWVDTLIMRVVDIILSVPNLLLAVSIAAILGQTPFAVMIAIGASQVPIFARLLRARRCCSSGRATTCSRRRRSVSAAAASRCRTCCRTPSAPVIVQGTLTLATAVIDAAALSFLGLGAAAPATAEWGRMLTYAQAELAIAPVARVPPGYLHRRHRARLHLAGRSAA